MTRRWPRRGLRDQRPRSQRRTLLLLEVHFDCSGCDEQRLGHFLGGTAIDLLGGTAIDGQARHAQLAQVRASRPLVRIRRRREHGPRASGEPGRSAVQGKIKPVSQRADVLRYST